MILTKKGNNHIYYNVTSLYILHVKSYEQVTSQRFIILKIRKRFALYHLIKNTIMSSL